MKPRAVEDYLTPPTRRGLRSRGRFDVPSYLYPYMPSILDEAKTSIEQAIRLRKGDDRIAIPVDIVDWAQERFYIPATGKPIQLYPHQQGILRLAFTRNEQGHFPYRTIVYSTIKQSGKSTIAGLVQRWYAETQQRHSELYAIGNDKEQAKTRSFREVRRSLELTPGYDTKRERLPGEWELLKETMRCVRTGTEIRALAVDAKGEAGGKPAIQVWTELWGFENEDALRFWDELTPIPTIPDSLRIVETYAGYLQESTLLLSLYEQGLEGRQFTAGELTERTGAPLDAFAETRGDPDALIPIWENANAEMLMYWDSGLDARRMPWQLDERGQRYYQQQELTLLPAAFARLHRNEWVSDTSNFIQAEIWDACHDSTIPALEPGDRTPLVLGVDAATTGDCFGIVAVSRHPARHDEIAVRAVKKWDPKESGGVVDYDEAERFIRFLCHGGHMILGAGGKPILHPKPPFASVSVADPECERCIAGDWDVLGYNVVHVAFDPYQLEAMAQRLAKDRVVWVEGFSQAGDRLRADRSLYDMILTKKIWHRGIEQADLRQHVLNAGAKLQKDQDSTLRLVKINPNRKIDLAVALSMASARCMYLVL